MDSYIAKLEAQESLQENAEVLNMLHIITLLGDYNSAMVQKGVVGIYLDNAYQLMVLDEQQLGLSGQLAHLSSSLSLLFLNITQLV